MWKVFLGALLAISTFVSSNALAAKFLCTDGMGVEYPLEMSRPAKYFAMNFNGARLACFPEAILDQSASHTSIKKLCEASGREFSYWGGRPQCLPRGTFH